MLPTAMILYKTGNQMLYVMKDFKYPCYVNVEEWYEM